MGSGMPGGSAWMPPTAVICWGLYMNGEEPGREQRSPASFVPLSPGAVRLAGRVMAAW
jgi:hypothetical protein